MTDDGRRDLLATMIDESERLNRFIANLLDMTRLESGAVVPNPALHDLGDIVGSALRRASKILAHHRVEVELAADLPMLELDAVLFEQVLFNLLDNAAKYAPPDTIRSGLARSEQVALQILDEGDGIPPADLERIFDKFYRAQKGDQVAPAPARAGDFARLRGGDARHDHGGEPHRPQGAVFTISCRSRQATTLDTAA